MKITNMLKDVRFGKPQLAGNMIVLPITGESYDAVSEEMLFVISRDSDYAHLTLENKEDRPVVVPQGTAYMTKQSAQDRTVLKATIIDANREKTVEVACIQSSQPGHMASGTDEFTFIPASLREKALEKEGRHEYNVLWDDIKEYMMKFNVNTHRSHLDDFYGHFRRELDEFIAPFESVSRQLGAVIFINNEIVGMEVYPNHNSWKKIWRKLIRDSYGTDAIGCIKHKNVKAFSPLINVDAIDGLEDLRKETSDVMQRYISFTEKLTAPLISEDINIEGEEKVGGFSINDIRLGTMRGQVIFKGDRLIYMTAVRRSL